MHLVCCFSIAAAQYISAKNKKVYFHNLLMVASLPIYQLIIFEVRKEGARQAPTGHDMGLNLVT